MIDDNCMIADDSVIYWQLTAYLVNLLRLHANVLDVCLSLILCTRCATHFTCAMH
jgi:hypothetical protein